MKVLPEKAPPPAVNPWVRGEGAAKAEPQEEVAVVVPDRKVSADAGPLAAEQDPAHDGMEGCGVVGLWDVLSADYTRLSRQEEAHQETPWQGQG